MENIKLRILFTIFLIGGISIIFTATTLQIYAQNKTEEKTMKMQNALEMMKNMTMKDMMMMMMMMENMTMKDMMMMMENMTMKDMMMMMTTQTEDNNDTSLMNKNNMSMK